MTAIEVTTGIWKVTDDNGNTYQLEATSEQEAIDNANALIGGEEISNAKSAKRAELISAMRTYEQTTVSGTINSKYLEFLPDDETELYLDTIRKELQARVDDNESNISIDVYINGSDTPVNVTATEFVKIYKNFAKKRRQFKNYVKSKLVEIKNANDVATVNSISFSEPI